MIKRIFFFYFFYSINLIHPTKFTGGHKAYNFIIFVLLSSPLTFQSYMSYIYTNLLLYMSIFPYPIMVLPPFSLIFFSFFLFFFLIYIFLFNSIAYSSPLPPFSLSFFCLFFSFVFYFYSGPLPHSSIFFSNKIFIFLNKKIILYCFFFNLITKSNLSSFTQTKRNQRICRKGSRRIIRKYQDLTFHLLQL